MNRKIEDKNIRKLARSGKTSLIVAICLVIFNMVLRTILWVGWHKGRVGICWKAYEKSTNLAFIL